MEYNIGFVIGDPSGDGHACTTEYHIVANHSVDEISEAYKKTTELLGFDFVKEVGVEFQSDPWIPEKFTKKLLELEIIDKEYVIESDSGTPLDVMSLNVRKMSLQIYTLLQQNIFFQT